MECSHHLSIPEKSSYHWKTNSCDKYMQIKILVKNDPSRATKYKTFSMFFYYYFSNIRYMYTSIFTCNHCLLFTRLWRLKSPTSITRSHGRSDQIQAVLTTGRFDCTPSNKLQEIKRRHTSVEIKVRVFRTYKFTWYGHIVLEILKIVLIYVVQLIVLGVEILCNFRYGAIFSVTGRFCPTTKISTVYIHIGALFAKLTKTVLSLQMHRYLSAINRNSNEKSLLFSNYADKRSYEDKKRSVPRNIRMF